MGIASSMKELAESIAFSHEDRTKTVLDIREEAKCVTGDARALIKDFQASRKKDASQVRKGLAQRQPRGGRRSIQFGKTPGILSGTSGLSGR